MPHWCDYKDFADGLKWLAEQNDWNIEDFQRSQMKADTEPPHLTRGQGDNRLSRRSGEHQTLRGRRRK
jgi:hypothetical protein